MDPEIIETNDGSHTLYSQQFDEIYHSRHGAISESKHIFIQNGLEFINKKEISVFETGFGTGLNALLSWIYAAEKSIRIAYHTVELFPVSQDIAAQINYPDITGHRDKFQLLHESGWNEVLELSPCFSLVKFQDSVLEMQLPHSYIDVVFFDAFSPEKQPEMWTAEIFKKMYDILLPGGILVTYCSKSYVRRNMQEAGFIITKIPGPHGKRDMVRAIKPV